MINKNVIAIGLGCILSCQIGYLMSFLNRPDPIIKEVEKPVIVTKEVIRYRDRPESRIDRGKRIYNSQDTDKVINSLLNKDIRQIHGMKPKDLRNICKSALSYIGVPDKEIESWIDLLMITAKIESNCGYLVCQVKGPAKGIFQLEPDTEKDMWNRFLKRHKILAEKIRNLRCEAHLGRHEAEYNIAYACAMAYCEYKDRKVNPVKMSVEDMVLAHKKHYNTYLGKTSKEHAWKNLAGAYKTGLLSPKRSEELRLAINSNSGKES